MIVAELIYPGYWIQDADSDRARRIQSMIGNLEESLIDIAVCLNLFDVEYLSDRTAQREHESAEQQSLDARQYALEKQLTTKLGHYPSPEEDRQIRFEAEVLAKRALWEEGQEPLAYHRRKIFLYSQMFVYELDQFRRVLNQLADEPGVPHSVTQAKAAFDTAFPTLRGIRDSEAHRDERLQGRKRKKQITLQPLDVPGFIKAPTGVIALGNLNNRKYGNLLEDGSYGEVEVSETSVRQVQACLQSIIDAFPWDGSPHHEPR